MIPIGFIDARPWTDAEDLVLRARYLRDGGAAVAAATGRSLNAVRCRARRLDLKGSKARWTRQEDLRLTDIWGAMSIGNMALKLGRSRHAIEYRAKCIGLQLGCPDGFVYLSTAARLAGFTVHGLRSVLRWAGVAIRTSMSPRKRRKWRQHIVDEIDVEDAVKGWMGTELLGAAARAREMVPTTLARVITTYGHDVPPRPARRRGQDGERGHARQWRISTKAIDAAIAEWRRRETVMSAAQRLGVPSSTLHDRLVRAGVERPPGKLWMVPIGIAEQLAAESRAAA